jgi:hypothetical protein
LQSNNNLVIRRQTLKHKTQFWTKTKKNWTNWCHAKGKRRGAHFHQFFNTYISLKNHNQNDTKLRGSHHPTQAKHEYKRA